MRRWNLFVDESGDFDNAADEVVVAALAIEVGTPGTHPLSLKRAITTIFRGVPWPPRAAEIDRPVYLALGDSLRRMRRCAAAVTDFERAADVIRARLQELSAADLREFDRAVEKEKRPGHDVVLRLDTTARRECPEEHAACRQATATALAGLTRVLGQAGAGRAPDGSPVAFIAAAAEARPGCLAQPTEPSDDRATSRYLALLGVLVGRVLAVLGRFDGPQEAYLYVLDRPIIDPRQKVPTRLLEPVVQDIVRRAVRGAHVPSVRIEVARVPRYDAEVDPRLVLADLVANRVRRTLRRESSLAGIERTLGSYCPLPMRSGVPSASHLAAAAYAHDRTDAPSEGEGASVVPIGWRRWAMEQHREWIAALGRR